MLKQTSIKAILLVCCGLMVLSLFPTQINAITVQTNSVATASPPDKLSPTKKGALADLMSTGLTKKQAIAYLALIRDDKGRVIKNFSKFHGRFYTFAKGKPSYKVGKARLNAWLKWYRSHKKHTKASAHPAKKQGIVAKTSSGQVTPIPSPTPDTKKQEELTLPKKVEKKIAKIDLPVTTLTLPINDPYDVPPAKVIYNDGTYEWIPSGNVKSSNEGILSIGKNGHLLNLYKQGEADLVYSFGDVSAKMHVVVVAENHGVRNNILLGGIALILLGILFKILSWVEKRRFAKLFEFESTPDAANTANNSAPPNPANAGPGPAPTP